MTSLTDLKPGCRLHVLIAMAMLGAPATKERICDKSGWSDEAVRDSLRWLSGAEQGLALCIPNGRWPVWSLTANARQLLLPLRALLDQTEQMSPLPADSGRPAPLMLSPLPADSINAHNQLPLSKTPDFPEKPARFSESAPSGLKPPSSSLIDREINNDDKELRANFEQALASAGVFQNARPQLISELMAEDGPGWLLQAVAWLAATIGEGATSKKERGATIYPALRDRRRADDIYLPPDGLNFQEALMWAERGGRQPMRSTAAPAPDPIHDDDAQAIPEHERTWRQVLQQLELQLPRGTNISMLQNTALAPGAEPGAYTVICPNGWTRDFLATRLAWAIERELKAVAGQAVTITYAAAG